MYSPGNLLDTIWVFWPMPEASRFMPEPVSCRFFAYQKQERKVAAANSRMLLQEIPVL